MSQPTFSDSSGTVIKLGPHGGSLVDVSQYFTDAGNDSKRTVLKSTTFGNTAVGKQGGLFDNSKKLAFNVNATIRALLLTWYALTGSPALDYEIAPDGTTTGMAKLTGSGFLADLALPLKVDALQAATCTLEVSGSETVGAY